MIYPVIRSARKTLSLQVRPDGQILVRAPFHTEDSVIERFVAEHRQWLEAAQIRQQQYLAAHPEPSPEQAASWRQQAEDLLPKKTAFFSKQMGLHCSGVTITGARTRFGSCSAKGHICFSWRLMAYPEAAIDYVVVHELAHLVHRNHGPAFYALIQQYLPDHRQRRELLRR